MLAKFPSVFAKWRKNLYLNFILFYGLILISYFLSYSIYYFTASAIDINFVYVIWFFFALLGNYLVTFFFGEGLWHHFGLILTRMTIQHLLEGFFLPIFYFAPLLVILILIGDLSIINFSIFNLVSFFFVVAINAFNEEIIFRGYVFQLFAERRSPYASVFVFSLIFASAHFANPYLSPLGFFNLFLAGVALSLMYLRTKSLWLGIGFHTGWNFFQSILLGSPISGVNHFQYSPRAKIEDLPEILFGGQFGIEGGFFTTLTLLLTIFLVARRYKPIPKIEARKFKEYFSHPKWLDLNEYLDNPRRILPIPKAGGKQNLNTRE